VLFTDSCKQLVTSFPVESKHPMTLTRFNLIASTA